MLIKFTSFNGETSLKVKILSKDPSVWSCEFNFFSPSYIELLQKKESMMIKWELRHGGNQSIAKQIWSFPAVLEFFNQIVYQVTVVKN